MLDLKDQTLGYLRVYKNANNFITCVAAKLSNVTGTAYRAHHGTVEFADELKNSRLFMVVRDPITHFISGYTEYIFRDEEHDLGSKSAFAVPVSSRERFELFVERLLQDVIAGTETLSAEAHHVYSQAAQLHFLAKQGISPSSVLLVDVKNSSRIHTIIKKHYSVSAIPNDLFVERSCGQHPTSADPKKTTEAATAVLADPSNIWTQVACLMHMIDYACFPEYLSSSLCLSVYVARYHVLKRILEFYV